jgi:hypothetical protein
MPVISPSNVPLSSAATITQFRQAINRVFVPFFSAECASISGGKVMI